MLRAPVAIALLVALSVPVSASLLEDTLAPLGLGVHYQEDGGVPGDAPGTCLGVDPSRTLVLDGSRSPGMLVEIDDEADAFAFPLDQGVVGERVAVDLLAGLAVSYDLAFDVFSPDCQSSVFNATSAYYDPAPAEPYQPPVGASTYEAKLTGYDCNSNEWKFLGNQMGGVPAPADIYVEWSNGEWEYVPVVKFTPATIAMYVTSSNLDVTVERAVIVLPSWYTGQFKLVHGPCDAVEGSNDPPQYDADANYGEFTVQEAGQHIVVITITEGNVEKAQGALEELFSGLSGGGLAATCHDVCSLALSNLSYDLGASKLAAA